MPAVYLFSAALLIILLLLIVICAWAWRLHREVKHLHKVLRNLIREGEEEDLKAYDLGKNGSF